MNPITLQSLFDEFKREKRYLSNVSAATIRAYEKSFLAFVNYHGCDCLVYLSESSLKAFMLSMLSSGLKPGAANSYARSFNSFLSWLYEARHTQEHLRIPLTKAPKRVLKTYTTQEVEAILSVKTTRFVEKRVMVLLGFLIDTGVRISEALTLIRSNLDLDNFLATVYGKGGKERIVPISQECRKALYKWLKTHKYKLVFCTRDGGPLEYHNIVRDFHDILDKAGVEKSEGCFHAFRRYFGQDYMRNGGNPFYLQQIFGHTTMAMTKQYIEANKEDLANAHLKLSPLERLKRRK